MYKVTYKENGASELQVKYFKNSQVAESFAKELGGKFISLEVVESEE